MIRYINIKTKEWGVETMYEINSKDFKTMRDFRKEITSCLENENLSGVPAYVSSRCTKEWRVN